MTTDAIKKAERELDSFTIHLTKEAVEGLLKTKYPSLLEGKNLEGFSVHYYPDAEDVFIKGYYEKTEEKK